MAKLKCEAEGFKSEGALALHKKTKCDQYSKNQDIVLLNKWDQLDNKDQVCMDLHMK